MSMSIKETKQFMDLVFKLNIRSVPLLLGHTGIGKTEIMAQYAMDKNWDFIPLYVSQLEPSDFVGLYQINEDGRTSNCPPNWLPYKEIKTNGDKKEHNQKVLENMAKGTINPNGGIIFLDEINRGHEDIRQALYQFVSTGCIHTYSKPSHYRLIAAANPPDDYECYEFDKALINRFMWIDFVPQVEETMGYFIKKYGKSDVISWVMGDKSLIDYGENVNFERPIFSPRMVENAVALYEALKDQQNDAFVRKCLETMMVDEKVQAFLSFREELKHINSRDVMKGKATDKVDELLKNKRVDVLSSITLDLADLVRRTDIGDDTTSEIPKDKKNEYYTNIINFLAQISSELATVFIDALGDTYNNTGSIVKHPDIKKLKGKLKKYKDVL